MDAHHHHKRGADKNGWATSTVLGHYHNERGHDCVHNLWATDDGHADSDSVTIHHHHKRGCDCVEHKEWATSENYTDAPLLTVAMEDIDRRSYAEIEAELAKEEKAD